MSAGAAASLRQAGLRVMVMPNRSICALQSAMEVYEVTRWRTQRRAPDILAPLPETRRDSRSNTCARSKDRAIVSQRSVLSRNSSRCRRPEWHKRQADVDESEFADGKRIILLSEGRLVTAVRSRKCHGASEFRHVIVPPVSRVTNHTSGADRGFGPTRVNIRSSLYAPNHRRYVFRLHLAKIGVKLTTEREPVNLHRCFAHDGPFKPYHYGTEGVFVLEGAYLGRMPRSLRRYRSRDCRPPGHAIRICIL